MTSCGLSTPTFLPRNVIYSMLQASGFITNVDGGAGERDAAITRALENMRNGQLLKEGLPQLLIHSFLVKCISSTPA